VNFYHYDKGWHPTATLGVFGAAAAARLMALTEAETATAPAIAASFASGLKANFGTVTKPFHVGHCAQSGVMADILARQGMTASRDVFEHPQGFFNVFNGTGNYDADAVLRDWAEPLDIIASSAALTCVSAKLKCPLSAKLKCPLFGRQPRGGKDVRGGGGDGG
jgi:2-methylcitrate dehydratase PrpD